MCDRTKNWGLAGEGTPLGVNWGLPNWQDRGYEGPEQETGATTMHALAPQVSPPAGPSCLSAARER